ncbi:MAG: SDR family NAD(P)-dependent oxidoreductase [Dehalococcoidia bacterium]|nr:SDR family NAD(P)-dependent oxidoreductase [Dehalococcoidia bacterium]
MTIELSGRVALVTGAGRGLGRAYALDLARRGAKVIINDLGGSVHGEGQDLGPAEEAVQEIKAFGGEAIANAGSVSNYEDAYEMVKQAMDTWGRLDVVVCNAGILRDKAFHNMAEGEWDAVLGVHLKGSYNVLRHAWPVFRQQAYGRAILCTSVSGLYGNFGQANYSSAKAGMLGLMNTLKIEGAKYNVMVNCLGPIAGTRMTTVATDNSTSPDHVAAACSYLASEACTTTGMVIEARAGHYNRAAIVRSPGIDFDPNEIKSAEWFGENFEQITNLDKSFLMWDLSTPLDKRPGQ